MVSDGHWEENQKLKTERLQKEANILEIESIDEWKNAAKCHPDYYAMK